jgi:hypothetical protein
MWPESSNWQFGGYFSKPDERYVVKINDGTVLSNDF